MATFLMTIPIVAATTLLFSLPNKRTISTSPRLLEVRPRTVRPFDNSSGVRCTGPLVPVYGSSAAERVILATAQDFCVAQILGMPGTPYSGNPVPANQAIDVEYLSGDRTDHGGASIPCLNGGMSVGSTMVHGLTAPTGCNDPSGGSAASGGYNGAKAAQYADTYANGYNSNFISFQFNGDDCTNFVSQAFYAGGLGMRYNPPIPWAEQQRSAGVFDYTASWSVTDDTSSTNQNNLGFVENILNAGPTADVTGAKPYQRGIASSASQGDPVYYVWNSNSNVANHMAIIATSDGQSVDAHTSSRLHAYWTLADYNQQWATTEVVPVHIPAGTR